MSLDATTLATPLWLLPGLYMVASALAKANDLVFSIDAVAVYLRPPALARTVVIGLGLTEAALGGAVLAGAIEARPIAAGFLLVVTAGALVSTRRRAVADCGCHGRLAQLTPARSALLNLLLAAALLAASSLVATSATRPLAGVVGAVLAVAIGGAIGIRSAIAGSPIDFTRLKRGARWEASMLVAVGVDPAGAAPFEGDRIVLVVTAGCPICRAWARVMAAARALPDLPPVVALVGVAEDGSSEGLDGFPADLAMVRIGRSTLFRLARTAPMVAVVRDGTVSEVWETTIPEAIVARLRGAERETRAPTGK